jgi:hypothetical protein
MSADAIPTGKLTLISRIASPEVVSAPVRVEVLVSLAAVRPTPLNRAVGFGAVLLRRISSFKERV